MVEHCVRDAGVAGSSPAGPRGTKGKDNVGVAAPFFASPSCFSAKQNYHEKGGSTHPLTNVSIGRRKILNPTPSPRREGWGPYSKGGPFGYQKSGFVFGSPVTFWLGRNWPRFFKRSTRSNRLRTLRFALMVFLLLRLGC